MPKFISNKTKNIKVKYKLLLNLRFKIEVKVFRFKLNFINKSYRVWNLVSNKIKFAIFGFFCELLQILQDRKYTHMK
jgi:hypothetical protein